MMCREEPQTHEIRTNTHECVKDTHDKTEWRTQGGRVMSEYEEVIVRLDKANTIIEEIVRCKDCRWYKDFDGCFFSTAEVEPLDYCSHGIRKSEEESIREVARGFIELVDAMADRKTENSSEEPNNSTISKMEQVETDINVGRKDEPHIVGKHADVIIIDEPQTEEPPMDEYYKDHDEFYEPQTERSSE